MNTDVSTSGRIDRQVFERMHTNAALGVYRGSSLQRKRTGEVAGVDVEHGHVAVVGDAAKHLLVGKISSHGDCVPGNADVSTIGSYPREASGPETRIFSSYGRGSCREHGCVDIGFVPT